MFVGLCVFVYGVGFTVPVGAQDDTAGVLLERYQKAIDTFDNKSDPDFVAGLCMRTVESGTVMSTHFLTTQFGICVR